MSPIRPENRGLYPSDWATVVRPQILERAGRRCECEGECGLHPPLSICRCGDAQRYHQDDSGRCLLSTHAEPCLAYQFSHVEPRRCSELDGQTALWARGRIILTIAHLDHDPANREPSNLRAMCQRCHNRYDRDHRIATAARTRRERRGVGELFEAQS